MSSPAEAPAGMTTRASTSKHAQKKKLLLQQESPAYDAEDDADDDDGEALDFDGTEVVTHLFLGGEGCARDAAGREARGITHVLTVLTGFEKSFAADPDMLSDGRWKQVQRENRPTADLLSMLDDCVDFINGALAQPGARVCVHSLEGHSRCVAVVCAYLVKTLGMTLRDAVALLEDVQPRANMNRGFWRQLAAFEQAERGRASLNEDDLPGAVMFERDELDDIIARFNQRRAQAADSSDDATRGARAPQARKPRQAAATGSLATGVRGNQSPTSATGIGLMSLGSPQSAKRKAFDWGRARSSSDGGMTASGQQQQAPQDADLVWSPRGKKSPRGSFDDDPASASHAADATAFL